MRRCWRGAERCRWEARTLEQGAGEQWSSTARWSSGPRPPCPGQGDGGLVGRGGGRLDRLQWGVPRCTLAGEVVGPVGVPARQVPARHEGHQLPYRQAAHGGCDMGGCDMVRGSREWARAWLELRSSRTHFVEWSHQWRTSLRPPFPRPHLSPAASYSAAPASSSAWRQVGSNPGGGAKSRHTTNASVVCERINWGWMQGC